MDDIDSHPYGYFSCGPSIHRIGGGLFFRNSYRGIYSNYDTILYTKMDRIYII